MQAAVRAATLAQSWRAINSRRARYLFQAAIAGCLVALAAYDTSYWLGAFRTTPLAQDTSLYYVAAQIGLSHGWSHIYDLSLQAQFFSQLQPGFAQSDFFIYANPPPLAWLVVPLTAFPAVAAYLVVVGLSVCALVGAALMAAPRRGRTRIIWILASLAWYPVIYGLRLGQVPLLVGFVVVLSWWLEQRGRPELAGVALALTAIKPQLAFLVAPCLLLSGRWRLALAWLAASVILIGLSVVSLGMSGIEQYAGILAVLRGAAYNKIFTLASLGGGATITAVLQIVVVGATLAAAVRIRRRGSASVIAAALIGGLLAAPYVHVDDFAVLVPAAWLLVRAGRPLYQTLWLLPLAVAMELAWVLGPLPILTALAVGLLMFFLPSRQAARATTLLAA